MFAEAKTSAGAPCWICAESVFDPPKEYRCEESICGKTSVRDAAAYTVICACDIASARPANAASTMQSARLETRGVKRRSRRKRVLSSVLEDHVRRLDDRGRGHSVLEPELLDSVARDDGDEADGVADHDLDLRHEAVDLDVGDDPVEAVAGADVRPAAVAAHAVDLGGRYDPPVAPVALDLESAGLVPATERVEADAEGG